MVAIAVIFLMNFVALASATWLISLTESEIKTLFHDTFHYLKVYELVLQFLLIAVLGGTITLVYRILEQSRDRRRARREALEDFYKTLLEAHHACKRVRRLLRASSIDYRYCQRQTYERLMVELEDAQLKHEALAEEAGIRKELFTRDRGRLVKRNLSIAEEYLGDLMDEFENNFKKRSKLRDLEVMALPDYLRIFIEPLDRSGAAQQKYFLPIRNAQNGILALIERRRINDV